MGLLYVFPVSQDEKDFVEIKDKTTTLKSYGLPYIFWGYAAAVLIVIVFMFLAIKAPVMKLIQLGDETDATLGYSLLTFISLLPVFILSFFFYEKRLIRKDDQISIQHRVYGLKVFSETFKMNASEPFSVAPFLSSPNVARLKDEEGTQGFQNKGYFILWLNTDQNKKIQLDRHSRKADLVKLQELLLS